MINRHIIFIHILIALMAAVVMYVSTKPLLAISETVIVADAVISGCILSVLLFFLKNIVRYGNFSSLLFQQQLINYCALGLLFLVSWIGMEYIILYMSFSAEEYKVLYVVLPTRVIIALLTYCLAILIYLNNMTDRRSDEITILENKDEIEAEFLGEEATKTVEVVERIVVKNGQKIDVVMITDIVCILAEGDYVMIHTINGKFMKEQTMKSIESVLPLDRFVRIHRSSIINVEFIAQIELYNKQNQILKLKNGMQVKVSLTGYKSLKGVLGL